MAGRGYGAEARWAELRRGLAGTEEERGGCGGEDVCRRYREEEM